MDVVTGSRLRWLRQSLELILLCSVFAVATFFRTRPWIILQGVPPSKPALQAVPKYLVPPSKPALQAVPKYLIVGSAKEQASINRYCVAYAIKVANLTHRELVVPGFTNGSLRNPAENVPDYFDFWEPPDLEFTTVTYIRMHVFLKMLRLDSAKMSKHTYQPSWGLPPENFAKTINETTTLAFLDFETGGECWMLLRMKGLKKVVNALAKPRKELVEFATSFLEELGPDAFILHWRSLTDIIALKVQDQNNVNLTNHYLKCAKRMWEKAQSVALKNGVVSKNRVVVFSDIHLNYREYMPLFRRHPDLLADRVSAIKYLEDIGAANGDELLNRRLDTHRLPTTESGMKLRDDYTTQHVIITEILVRAKRLLACANGNCGQCSRLKSEFVQHVLDVRRTTRANSDRETWSL